MTSNGLCIVWLPATPTLNPVPAALPVSRFDSPPVAVPPGGVLAPGGPTNSCGSITVACATPAPAKTASAAARAAPARTDEDLVVNIATIPSLTDIVHTFYRNIYNL